MYGSKLLSFEERGNPAIRLPFVLQYASHLYGSILGKMLGVGVTGTFMIKGPFLRLTGHFFLKENVFSGPKKP